MAPDSFTGAVDHSYVFRQPLSDRQISQALKAIVSCPVGAIGSETAHDFGSTLKSFPDPIDGAVFHCGFHSEKSFGAASYFIKRRSGNVLVDSPRFARRLVNSIENLGGIDLMFLTHRDDIAEHQKFADHFGCKRVIHSDDAAGGLDRAEWLIDGQVPVTLGDELTVYPVPGHTKGSACLHYQDKFLFTGDHLAWNVTARELRAFRTACWYNWRAQTESMTRLRGLTFEWVLPGHGRRINLPSDRMALSLENCIRWMNQT